MNNLDQRFSGSGSGGGGDMENDGSMRLDCISTNEICGNQIVLLSRKTLPIGPKIPEPSSITILAVGGAPTYDDDGEIGIRAAKRVRISSGGPSIPLINPAVNIDINDGVEIVVPLEHSIGITCGGIANTAILMSQKGIAIDAGLDGSLTLTAGIPGIGSMIVIKPDGITLSTAAGQSQIVMNQQGITIVGMPQVQINPIAPLDLPGFVPRTVDPLC